jgi:hypothetical protein
MQDLPASNLLQLELHVTNFGAVKDYYGKLGFEVVWERAPEGFKGYMVLRRDGNILCFWGGSDVIYQQTYFKKFKKDTPSGKGVELVLMVDEIESFYEEVKNVANIVEPLVRQPWGLKDFRCVDPFGYYLRFTSKHNILDPSYAVE